MISHANYFSNENMYLSNSKLSDFLRCPEYFYKKHITKEIKTYPTDAMIIGKAVDCWLTEGKDAFDKKFICVTRRSLKNPPEDVTELNNTQYELVIKLCEAVIKTTAYKSLSDHIAQKILFKDMQIGQYFKGLCGIPDWFKIVGDTCYITDLKTAQDGSPEKYKWTLKGGYYRQQAFYQLLIQHNYPEVKFFVSRHLVVEKDTDGINQVYAYELNPKRISEAKNEILGLIDEIAKLEEFNKRDADFDNPIYIDEFNDEF